MVFEFANSFIELFESLLESFLFLCGFLSLDSHPVIELICLIDDIISLALIE
jgi:hypothetical protein